MKQIYEPLDFYRGIKDDHAKRTLDLFEKLLKQSRVDQEANNRASNSVKILEKRIEEEKNNQKKWNTLSNIITLLTIVCVVIGMDFILSLLFDGYYGYIPVENWVSIVAIVLIFPLMAIAGKALETLSQLDQKLDKLKSQKLELINKIYQDIKPLLDLFNRNQIPDLFMQSVPLVKLDRFASQARLDQFIYHHNYSLDFNNDSSVLFCQTGDLNSNPFVFMRKLDYFMGTTTYKGTLNISWQELETETYTDSNGRTQTRSVWVTKSETLVAYLEKPAPKYIQKTTLIYGNQSTPDLIFSRTPSSLSGNGLFKELRVNLKISSLEKKSKRLDGFTIMSNQKFDALFGATDRNNEQQFRLLFTPLAQQEMVKLLEDSDLGYGDNFTFHKNKLLSTIESPQLNEIDLSASPQLFRHYDINRSRELFVHYSNAYLKIVFFSFAPLITIPLFQNPPQSNKPLDPNAKHIRSFWELEELANAYPKSVTSHPESVTENILKTRRIDSEQIEVTAYGFRTIKHTSYISVRGGDGYSHNVPVDWLEYIPVSKKTTIDIKEKYTEQEP